ncbi:hypothetical protein A9Q84_16575 [Halobacteriovorax marinus]|uniref:Uncharacterized protein n=1 Tax=Halobacteriovorax marinus TaxID=97084 RepID=A0A1Y5F4G5_9BACT|nr:hypothetical protein A9Q84_16575 [Halobacteriovorax marinus]
MFNKFVLIFIFTAFFSGVVGESMGNAFDHEEDNSQLVAKTNTILASEISYVDSDCNDCEDESCHSEGAHCVHHCSGVHNVVITNKSVALSSSLYRSTQILWKYYFQYSEPSLDPALKPPLFS